jgi:hypothetical protein
VILYSVAIVFFCFFYTALVFNSRETADNLKKSGAFIPGIRPGDQTARYIDKILGRLTLAGCGVHHCRVFAARVPRAQVQRAVLFRWDFSAHHRGCHDGFLGSGSVLRDVSAVRLAAEEGKFQVELKLTSPAGDARQHCCQVESVCQQRVAISSGQF